MPQFTLYGRHNCHLCHEMQLQLEALRPALQFDLDIVDVQGVPALEHLYGARVPVLIFDGTELCEARLDLDAVRSCLSGERA